MYDVYDILQSHVRYLKNMRLVAVHDPDPELVPRCEYDDLMNNVPEECASVAVLLEAMLRQIDQNFHDYEEGTVNKRIWLSLFFYYYTQLKIKVVKTYVKLSSQW